MRTKHLLLFFAVLVTGGFTAMRTATSDWNQQSTAKKAVVNRGDAQTQSVVKGIEFDPNDLQAIRIQLKAAQAGSVESDELLDWELIGPNNVAGRIRAIIVDQENPHIMYAGAASGGVYKSETNGQYWFPVKTDYDASVLSVTSMVQAADNTIYYSTGEAFDSFTLSKQSEKAYAGGGVFKLAPGATEFTQIESTDPINNTDFFGITQVALDPSSASNMYLSTWKGAYKSTDAGVSWSLINSLPTGYVSDIKVNENGVVALAVENRVFIGVQDVYVQVSGIDDRMIDTGGYRFEFAFAPTNPDCLYAIGATVEGELLGVYRSTSAGQVGTWETVGLGSDEFKPFYRSYAVGNNIREVHDGVISMSIAVDDKDEDYIFIGGTDLWTGYKVEGVEPFQWTQKTYNAFQKFFPQYVTANIHSIVAHPSNDNYYLGTDGGVFRYSLANAAVRMNSYLTTGRFNDVSFGPDGEVFAGADDNGTFYNDFNGPGSQFLFGSEIMGENEFGEGATHGFQTIISQIQPNILFLEYSEARLRRTLDYGESTSKLWTAQQLSATILRTDTRNSAMASWETHDYQYGQDHYTYKTFKDLDSGIVQIGSYNIAGAPISNHLLMDYPQDTMVPFTDPYKFMFAYGIKGRLWLTRNAAGANPMVDWDWIDVFNIYKYYKVLNGFNVTESNLDADINDVVFSRDGHHLYFTIGIKNDTVNKYEIFRLDSIHTVLNSSKYAWSLATQAMNPDTIPDDILLPYTRKLGTVYDREITSLTIDPNDKTSLIVSIVDYDNEDHVYLCSNANTYTSTSFVNNFRSIQGNLPRIGVYDGVVDIVKPGKLIVGTEIGVWSTEDYTASEPVWTFDSKGVGSIPVTSIKQQQSPMEEYANVNNYGAIYISTYGGGLFVDYSSYQPREDEDILPLEATNITSSISVSVYPNPVLNSLNLDVNIAFEGAVTVELYNVTGQLVMAENVGTFMEGLNQHQLDVANLQKGVFFVKVSSGDKNDVVKFIKQ